MPTYSVVIFYDKTNIPQKQYMTEQHHAIKNTFPNLTTELTDSDDSRLTLYSTLPQRMPALMVFKDGARMQTKHAKIAHTEAINWIRALTS